MAGDWEKLAMDYQSSTEALIAEVDCTNDVNQSICTENGVQGFPTLKYGNPAALEDYEGGRDYESLKSFAQDNLKPTCSPFHLDLCQGEEKEKIESFFAMSEADLKAKIEAVDEIVKKSEEEFEKEVEKLQDMYMKMMEEHENKLQEEKNNANYKLIKAVVAFKKTQESDGEL
jgi:Thioredoxin.